MLYLTKYEASYVLFSSLKSVVLSPGEGYQEQKQRFNTAYSSVLGVIPEH